MKLKGLSSDQIRKIAKSIRALVPTEHSDEEIGAGDFAGGLGGAWQPEDDPSVDTSDSIKAWISRLENILEMSEGDEQFDSVFSAYGDTEKYDREDSVREMLIDLAQDILNSGFVSDSEMTTKTRIR